MRIGPGKTRPRERNSAGKQESRGENRTKHTSRKKIKRLKGQLARSALPAAYPAAEVSSGFLPAQLLLS